jgi:Ca2+-binding EF-hand superfamily protein
MTTELREVFDLVDVDRSGSISAAELERLLKMLAIKSTKQEVDTMIAEVDSNRNGTIDFDEFVSIMTKKVNVDYSKKEIERSFKYFVEEKGPEGCISKADLEFALQKFGSKPMNFEDCSKLLDQLQYSKDTKWFNYKNYLDAVMRETE